MKNIWVVSVAVVVTAVIFGGGVYLWKNGSGAKVGNNGSQVSSQLPIVPTFNGILTADTTNWKTFKSDKLGFSFKYPSTWELDNQGENGTELIDLAPSRWTTIEKQNTEPHSPIRNLTMTCSKVTTFDTQNLLGARSIKLDSGISATFGLNPSEFLSYVYQVKSNDTGCEIRKIVGEESPLTKEEDNEGIGIINSFQFSK
jgi:hypothetical protein